MNDAYKAKPPANFYRFVWYLFVLCSVFVRTARWDVEPVFLELILEDDSVLYLKKQPSAVTRQPLPFRELPIHI